MTLVATNTGKRSLRFVNSTGEQATLLQGFPGIATRTAYYVQSDLAYEEFADLLEDLLAIEQGGAWWLGDLLRAFEGAYGQRYVAALPDQKKRRVKAKTCANAKWVCGCFETSRRREDLSFGHHEAVASLKEQDEQDLWLDRAEKEGWSVHRLREELQKIKKPAILEAPDLAVATTATASPLQSFMDADGEVRFPDLAIRPTPPPATPTSFAASALDEFYGDTEETDPSAETEGAPVAAPPVTIPASASWEVIDADLHLWVAIQKSRSPDIRDGYIERPVLIGAKSWVALPVPIAQDGTVDLSDGSVYRQEAVRILPEDTYISSGLNASRPIVEEGIWKHQVARGERAEDNFAGLRVTFGGARFIVMPNRAVFTYRHVSAVKEGAQEPAAAPETEPEHTLLSGDETSSETEAKEFLNWSQDDVDDYLAGELWDIDEEYPERFLPREKGQHAVHLWSQTLCALARRVKELESSAVPLSPDRAAKVKALCERSGYDPEAYVGMLIDQRFDGSGLTLPATQEGE